MNALTTIADTTASGAITEAGLIASSNVWTISLTILGFTLFVWVLAMIYKAFGKKG